MSEERLDRVRELFLAALELSETERRNFLESVCAGDVDLVREVEELLECSRSSPSFLTVPAGLEHREWFETEDEESGSRSTGKEEGAFAAESEDADEIPMPRSIGGYEIIRALGEGGMGIVYLAEQPPPLRRKVALKVIKLGMDTR
ncbi:MAG TPA: hypothetical protein VK116_14950, partial [Planctomycetota bacterium]|nr:hypothetical protein [Planctomycetota bacterium]